MPWALITQKLWRSVYRACEVDKITRTTNSSQIQSSLMTINLEEQKMKWVQKTTVGPEPRAVWESSGGLGKYLFSLRKTVNSLFSHLNLLRTDMTEVCEEHTSEEPLFTNVCLHLVGISVGFALNQSIIRIEYVISFLFILYFSSWALR